MNFYSQIPGFKHFREFSQKKHYVPLPLDWDIIVTDIQNSTVAIESGRYKDVNAVGAASIVAIVNALKPIVVPFVFGGDGATLAIPRSMRDKAEAALLGTKDMAEKSFGLSLRIGIIGMNVLSDQGKELLVGKFRPHEHYEQAMFMGNGLDTAESLIKRKITPNPYLISNPNISGNADFSGFECRWNEVPSPFGETISLLVKTHPQNQIDITETYSKIIEDITKIYGDDVKHHPLKLDQLTLAATPKKLSAEIKIKTYFSSFKERVFNASKIFLYALIGRIYIWKKIKTENADWGAYKTQLIANSDFQKFDGALRMVISGTRKQSQQLRKLLEIYHGAQKIVFGLYINPAAIITCLISNYHQNHVHFIDGSAGGYAMAAKEMKKQLSLNKLT
ncbi:MAG: DUF3095 domain-containing protein [Elusimicrobiota bacterium]